MGGRYCGFDGGNPTTGPYGLKDCPSHLHHRQLKELFEAAAVPTYVGGGIYVPPGAEANRCNTVQYPKGLSSISIRSPVKLGYTAMVRLR